MVGCTPALPHAGRVRRSVPAAATPAVIRRRRSVRAGRGRFTRAGDDPRGGGRRRRRASQRDFADLVRRTRGFAPAVDRAAARRAATPSRSSLDPAVRGRIAEAYTLDIDAEGRHGDRAATGAGCSTARSRCGSCSRTDGQASRSPLPALRIEDAPRFAWRGLMLDSRAPLTSRPSSSSASSTGWRCTSSTRCTGT